MSDNWKCPYCRHAVVITDERLSIATHRFNHGNRRYETILTTRVRVCPNEDCKEFSLDAQLWNSHSRTHRTHAP